MLTQKTKPNLTKQKSIHLSLNAPGRQGPQVGSHLGGIYTHTKPRGRTILASQRSTRRALGDGQSEQTQPHHPGAPQRCTLHRALSPAQAGAQCHRCSSPFLSPAHSRDIRCDVQNQKDPQEGRHRTVPHTTTLAQGHGITLYGEGFQQGLEDRTPEACLEGKRETS